MKFVRVAAPPLRSAVASVRVGSWAEESSILGLLFLLLSVVFSYWPASTGACPMQIPMQIL